MNIDRNLLKRTCELVVENPVLRSIQNPDGTWTTYCNVGTQMICESMGLTFFANEMANQMYDRMDSSPAWKRIGGQEAHMHANEGRVVIAARKEAQHGHVTVIYPATEMADSPSLKKLVPFCANIGAVPPHKNDVVPVSQAFAVAQGEPDYFFYIGA